MHSIFSSFIILICFLPITLLGDAQTIFSKCEKVISKKYFEFCYDTNLKSTVTVVFPLDSQLLDESFYEVMKPFKEAFQKIHDDAKQKGVNISNAKEYLDSLSQEELSTLQNYTLLVNEIDVDTLSDEGAYNLLLDHYEKYDFNSDGFIGKGTSIIPSHFSNTEKKALVDTFNSMESGSMLAMATLLMPPMKFVNGEIVPDPKGMQFDDIQKRVESILNPNNTKYSTQEFRDGIEIFWKELMKNYSKTLEEKAYYVIK